MPNIHVEDGDMQKVLRYLKELKVDDANSESGYSDRDSEKGQDKGQNKSQSKGHKGQNNRAYTGDHYASGSNGHNRQKRDSDGPPPGYNKGGNCYEYMGESTLDRSGKKVKGVSTTSETGSSVRTSASSQNWRNDLRYMHEEDRRRSRRKRGRCHWWVVLLVFVLLLLIGAIVGIVILALRGEKDVPEASVRSTATPKVTNIKELVDIINGGRSTGPNPPPNAPPTTPPAGTGTDSPHPFGGTLIEPEGRSERYLVVQEAVSWADALRRCHAIQSHLAVMETLDELDKLSNELAKLEPKSQVKTSHNYYIGGIKLTAHREGHWFWYTDGEPINELMWATGEPNFSLNEEYCVGIDPHTADGKLNDTKCLEDYAHLEGFVCELPPEM